MPCPDPLLVHAYADGELDAESALRLEEHFASCTACEELRRSIQSAGTQLRSTATYHRLAPAQRTAILDRVWRDASATPGARSKPTPRPRGAWHYWAGTASGAVAAAVVALAVTLWLPRAETTAVVGDVVGAHVRSLLSNRLIDVESTDRHTVKPWFAGHTNVSPPVADFGPEDYRLVGGRVDYVDGHQAAVVVYRHGTHIINVFAWPGSGTSLPSRTVTRDGYHLAFWTSGSLTLCAVSDASADQLLGLERLLQAVSTADSRE